MSIRYWGLAEKLGRVYRRRFPAASEELVRAEAQRLANRDDVEVDYWDEADKSYGAGKPCDSLRTVSPEPELAP